MGEHDLLYEVLAQGVEVEEVKTWLDTLLDVRGSPPYEIALNFCVCSASILC